EYSRGRGVSREDQFRIAHPLNRARANGAQLDARGALARLGADDPPAPPRYTGPGAAVRVEAPGGAGARNLLLPAGC
ncbi:hypothetical protein QMO37_32735, partial [Pseudomonas aeruginosa]|uniref:hypothetical protein n=1 Tax=Pseudomonas aeruginosa TaxID=287 RepID=UPI0024AF08AE